MGFFDSIFSGLSSVVGAAAPIATTALGLAAPIATGGLSPAIISTALGQPSAVLAAAPTLGTAATQQVLALAPESIALQVRSETGQTLQQILSIQAGRMKNKVTTVVFTVQGMTGQIVKMQAMEGRPAIMASEARRARRFIKQISDASQKLPRKQVRESESTKIKNQILQSAVARITGPCPS